MSLNWNISEPDADLVFAVMDRAEALSALSYNLIFDQLMLTMDILSCHLNGTPLDLAALLHASDADFIHDVWGIRNNLDRTSGQLRNCFSPRFSAQVTR